MTSVTVSICIPSSRASMAESSTGCEMRTADLFIEFFSECLEVYPECPKHRGELTEGFLGNIPVRYIDGTESL